MNLRQLRMTAIDGDVNPRTTEPSAFADAIGEVVVDYIQIRQQTNGPLDIADLLREIGASVSDKLRRDVPERFDDIYREVLSTVGKGRS